MRKAILTATMIALAITGLWASEPASKPGSEPYVPTAENLQAREQFRDNKFGIFLHWGLYSLMGQGEWFLQSNKVKQADYQTVAGSFYPSKFDADAWVKAFADAGAKYICITARHHDGFSMFDTAMTDYDIVDATPYGRDPMKELAAACQKYGLKLHFYYSHVDWGREDYPWGDTGRNTGRQNPKGDWPSYYNFMNGQLRELLTNYGPVGAIWFDGWWDHRYDAEPFDWQLPEQYQLIHDLQPACLVINNHHQAPMWGEDVQTFERDLPGKNTAGFDATATVSDLPLETTETMNSCWGYKINDLNYKSLKQLVHYIVKTAGRNANLLMNIGPRADGTLPTQALERLAELAEWMQVYSPTIHGTRGGIIEPHAWGATTQKGNTLYVHILDHPDATLYLPLQQKVLKARVFADGTPVKFTTATGGIVLDLGTAPTEIDHVIELTLKP